MSGTAGRPILLLGRDGQLGWELRRALAPLGPVLALGRGDVDLADGGRVRACVRDAAPALIVNAAAYTAVDGAEDEEALALAVNGTAPGILAEEARRLGVPLVHYSTDYVFGGDADRSQPYDESAAPAPVNAYGRSKLAGEAAVRAVGPAHLILRTSWIYAARGRNFLRTMQRLAGERDELRVVDDQIGSPTWARALAEATALILARCGAPQDTTGLAERGGLYHLAAAGSVSWHGFAQAIVDRLPTGEAPHPPVTVVPITTAEYPTPAARPAYSVLDCTAAARTFGIALPPWQEQLALCLDG